MRPIFILAVLVAARLSAQAPVPTSVDPWQAIKFLEGTWESKTPAPSSGVAAAGTYVFRKELGGHILARHSSTDACKGPAEFDCEHHDLLYVYQDAAGQPLKAIYFDSEGHVLHYDVTTPAPSQVVFLSDSSVPGPQFRLVYELKDAIMSGKFQMHMPGQTEWKSYLEWSGPKSKHGG